MVREEAGLSLVFNKERYIKDLGVDDTLYEMLDFLIQNESDVRDFHDNYWEAAKNKLFAVSEFRRKKMRENHISLSEFLNRMLLEDEVEVLQSLFQHPVTLEDVKGLHHKVINGEITLLELYERHVAEPDKKLTFVISPLDKVAQF